MEYIEPKPVEEKPHAKRNKIILFSSIGALLTVGIALTYYFTIKNIFLDYDNIDLFTYSYRYDDEEAGVRIDSVKDNAILPANFRIPNKLNGRPVTEIADEVFKDRTELESVTLPSSLKIIGNECFYGCENLKTFNVPNSISSIGTAAFDDTAWLENQEDGEVVVGQMLYTYKGEMDYPAAVLSSDEHADEYETVVDLSKYVNMSSGVFKNQTNLVYVEFPENFTEIYESTFQGCTSLTTVKLSDSLKEIGDYAFSECSSLTEINIPSSVTSIGSEAFSYSHLSGEITLNEGLEYLGSGAFKYCRELASAKIPGNTRYLPDYIFEGCEKLTNVSFDSSELSTESKISYIGSNAFYGTTIKEFHVPFNVGSIKSSAFSHCENLERIYLYNNEIGSFEYSYVVDEENGTSGFKKSESTYQGLVNFEVSMFDSSTNFVGIVLVDSQNNVETDLNEVHIPLTLESLGGKNADSNFFNGTSIEKVYLGKDYSKVTTGTDFEKYIKDAKLTTLPPSIFMNATKLTLVDFGSDSTIQTINRDAFKNCTSLETISIADSVTTLDTGAFEGCVNLKNVKLSNGAKTVAARTFYGCESLTSVTVPNNYTSIGEYAFANCPNLASVSLGENISNINSYAFYNCTSLTDIVIPNTCRSFANSIFENCSALTNITLSNNQYLTEVKANLFKNAKALKSIVLESNYTSIGENAFADSGLEEITLKANKVVSFKSTSFANCNLKSIYVPKELVNDYQIDANWSTYSSIILIAE